MPRNDPTSTETNNRAAARARSRVASYSATNIATTGAAMYMAPVGLVNAANPAPKPTIAGIKEANLVSDWSKRRARGERVTMEPPSLNADGSVTETTKRMGRIDSPAGRKMAALEAEKAAKKKAEEEKAAAIAAAKAEKEAARAQALAAKEAAKNKAAEPAVTATVPAPGAEQPAAETQTASGEGGGTVSRLKKRLLGMFGG